MTYIFGLIIFSAAAYIDGRQKIIPDRLSLAMLLVGFIDCLSGRQSFSYSFGSALAIFVLFIVVCLITDFLGSEGIGGGDIKLMTATAFTFGLSAVLAILFISELMAGGYLLLKKRAQGQGVFKLSVPMAPFFLISYITYLLI